MAAMMGTVVPESLMREFGERYPHLHAIQGYGATETSPLLTLTHLKDAPRKMASAGKAVPRAELKIIGQDGKEVETGQMGEIIARGPQIMKGYFKDPKATARKIKEGWYYTGDLGRMDEDGYLYVLGRADDMVITGGLNVYPSEVETVLLNHPKVQEAAVVGIPDAKRGQIMRANVVLKHGETATHREILKFCKERLASFKMPRQLEFKDSLPKSRTGKIAKRQLRTTETTYEKWRDFISGREAFIGPLALILIWYLISAFKWVNPFFLPSPWMVLLKLKELLLSGMVYTHIGKTDLQNVQRIFFSHPFRNSSRDHSRLLGEGLQLVRVCHRILQGVPSDLPFSSFYAGLWYWRCSQDCYCYFLLQFGHHDQHTIRGEKFLQDETDGGRDDESKQDLHFCQSDPSRFVPLYHSRSPDGSFLNPSHHCYFGDVYRNR